MAVGAAAEAVAEAWNRLTVTAATDAEALAAAADCARPISTAGGSLSRLTIYDMGLPRKCGADGCSLTFRAQACIPEEGCAEEHQIHKQRLP